MSKSDTAPVEDESSMQYPLILDPIDETQSEKVRIKKRVAAVKNCLLMKPNRPPLKPNSLLPMPPVRRSTRERPVDYYGSQQAHITIHHEPTCLKKQPIARRKPNGMRAWARK